MGFKHQPAPVRDPRPKGVNWRVGNGKMAWKLATDKNVRDAEFGKGGKGGKGGKK